MTIFETINLAKSEARKRKQVLNNYNLKRLMAYTINVNIEEISVGGRYINISNEQQTAFMNHVYEMLDGKPLQYITHQQNFMGIKFYVDENVLIPQPDTEILVDQTIKIIRKLQSQKPVRVLDLCTGSGAIAISLKKELGNLIEVTASDISEGALKVAQKNCNEILKNEIRFVKSDMFEDIDDKFDIIVSNPPYIKTGVINILPLDVQKEPHIALDGGEDGLDFYKIIKENLNYYLIKDGYLILEIGYDQKNEVQCLFKGSKCVKDFCDNDRVIIYRNKGEK